MDLADPEGIIYSSTLICFLMPIFAVHVVLNFHRKCMVHRKCVVKCRPSSVVYEGHNKSKLHVPTSSLASLYIYFYLLSTCRITKLKF